MKFHHLALIATVLLLTLASCDNSAQQALDLAAKNKAICLKSVQAMNTGDLSILDTIFAPDFIEHTPDPMVTEGGIPGLKQAYNMMRSAYPDIHLEVLQATAEGDQVTIFQTMTGTNVGYMGTMPPTSLPVKADGVDIFKLKDGKITEHWAIYDSFTMMMQLGMTIVPMDQVQQPDTTPTTPTGDTSVGH